MKIGMTYYYWMLY